MRNLAALSLLAILLLPACHTDSLTAPPPPPPPPPQGPQITVSALASSNHDTLTFTLEWGRAADASSYDVTVTVSGITGSSPTTGLPVGQSVPDTVITFKAVNTTYDSLAFHATVSSRRGSYVNPTPASGSWSWVRRPGPPGPIVVDSSGNNIIFFTGLDVHANHIGYENFPTRPIVGAPLYQGGEITRITACAYFKFSDGTVAMQSTGMQRCMYNYRVGYAEPARSVCTQQPPLWNPDGSLLQPDFHCAGLANAKVQAWADAQCVDWSSSDITSVTIDQPSCPPSTATEVAPVPGGSSSVVSATLRGTLQTASIELGWP